jgi:hypothetical protein
MSNFWDERLDIKWRYPDKPLEIFTPKLVELEERGGFILQQKLDGYRMVVMADQGQVRSCSRHRKALPVSQALLDKFLELDFPEPWMIDTEWIKLRTGHPETIAILDVFYMDGDWQGSKYLVERQEWYDMKKLPDGIVRPEEADEDFLEFFANQIDETVPTKEAWSEGVVAKKVLSTLIGARDKSEKNPMWMKCKWRAGQGGDTQVLTREDIIEHAA